MAENVCSLRITNIAARIIRLIIYGGSNRVTRRSRYFFHPGALTPLRYAFANGRQRMNPLMRPLWFDFADDSACWDICDEYLFGPDLLVAPVMEYGARQRAVYMPQGAVWTNVWTGEKIPGGQTVITDAPIEQIPLFFRDGARLQIVSE